MGICLAVLRVALKVRLMAVLMARSWVELMVVKMALLME